MGKRKDRWPDLCKIVEDDDGLPVRGEGVGVWSEDKLYFWNRYIDITIGAMSGNPNWNGLVYVDLFAGPGVCKIKESGRRIPGSPLIAAHATKPFQKIIVCELNKKLADACKTRLESSPAKDNFHVITGDCNEKISEIANLLPNRSLTLAFIDPTGLHVHFNTIATLTRDKRVDLLVLFADRMDIVRNVEKVYMQQQNSNLDLLLGSEANWREKYNKLPNQNSENICRLFAEIYQDQLARHLGYRVFRRKTMRSRQQGPLYQIIFASKHERGAEFWDKISQKDSSGQKNLF